ncbi:MAG TPA: hypothetical protein VNZ45_18195, partial [Bacteroidia bacterium]|nr:hypothetical protein [Bacteroidia bacterium]
MKIIIHKWWLLIIFLFAGWLKAYAVVEHFYNSRDGVHFAADSSITVKDDKYGTSLWSKIVKNALATDVVTLSLNEDTALFLSAPHTCSIDVEITWTLANGQVDSMAKTLSIAFTTTQGRAYNFRSSFRFNGGFIV